MNAFLSRHRKVLTVCLLAAVLLLTMLWIFSHSMKSGAASKAQSDKAAEAVRPLATKLLTFLHISPTEEHITILVRKTGHFLEFALLGFLTCIAAHLFGCQKQLRFLLPVGLCMFTACIDEGIQLFSPGRSGQLSDVLLDSAGGLAGTLLVFLIYSLCHAVHKKHLEIKQKI